MNLSPSVRLAQPWPAPQRSPTLLPAWALGPRTLARLQRLLLAYCVLLTCAIGLIEGAQQPQLQIFGLGLLFPGGGLLAFADLTPIGWAHLALAILTVCGFGLALLLWFATGNAIAPPLFWLLSAAGIAAMPHAPLSPAVVHNFYAALMTALVLATLATFLYQRRSQAARQEANEYLRNAVLPTSNTARLDEYSLEDLQRMRFLLDRALQPLDSFNGFQWLDQYQTAAVRYQLNFCGYALSLAQGNCLPACGAYLDTAQRNLILKQGDHRVWRYWLNENRWGNLQNDANPLRRQNIMYRGFVATQMAMFQAASAQRDFRCRDSLLLKHPEGSMYACDFDSLVAGLEREIAASPLGLAACEPNWVYPLCNGISALALQYASSARWDMLAPSFQRSLDTEFLDAHGRILPCRSEYTGLALPPMGGAMPQALPSFFLNALMPDFAMRQWLLLRKDLLRGYELNQNHFWRIDTGDYSHSRAAAYAATALAARELGDDEIAELCLQALEHECPERCESGIRYREQASVWAMAVELMARSNTKDGLRKLLCATTSATPGPRISTAAYPAVLVAAARFEQGLFSIVLYPGTEDAYQSVTLSGLRPHTRYVCVGGTQRVLTTDAAGEVKVKVDLHGRTELRIHRLF